MKNYILLIGILALLHSCQNNKSEIKLIDSSKFESVIDEQAVSLFTLHNQEGMTCQITNFGARLVNLWVKNKKGEYNDVVLGYDRIEDYRKTGANYIGATIGRFGNRISNGKFTLNDSTYHLTKNSGENQIHGGVKGFNNVVWDAVQLSESELQLSYLSPDGEEGFPGNMKVTLVYSISDDNELKIFYTATCDKASPINLTHHSFFNLNGAGNGDISDHLLTLNASKYLPIKEGSLPTGKILSVRNTPFDFTQKKSIGLQINENIDQLLIAKGYDHCFVLDKTGRNFAAKLESPQSGIIMDVYTNEPGIQLYSGNFLNGEIHIGKDGKHYDTRTAVCLETQHFPDSPNQANFPSTILKPGETYHSNCIYKFDVLK